MNGGFIPKKAREFTEREKPVTPVRDGQIPFQVNQNPIAAKRLTPNIDVNVNAVFDSRPVNSVDFYQTGGTLTTNFVGDVETAVLSYVIPNGRIAVVKFVSFEFEPIYPANTVSSVITTVTINGNAIPFNDAFSGPQTRSRIPTFLLVDQGQTLSITSVRTSTLTIAARIALSGVPYIPTFVGEIGGTMLVKRFIDLPFEVGSK